MQNNNWGLKRSKRRCVLCGAVLSRYNRSDACQHHGDAGLAKTIGKAKECSPQITSAHIPAYPQDQMQVVIAEARKLRRLEMEKFSDDDLTAIQIVNATGCVYGVKPETIKSGLRVRTIIAARQVATYLIREDIGRSLHQIGHFLEQNHTTVCHSYHKVRFQMEINGSLRDRIKAIRTLYQDMPENTLLSFGTSQLPSYKVLAMVADVFNFEIEALFVRKRGQSAIFPRQIAAYLLREDFQRSLSEIGSLLKQHHTTVLHGWRKIKDAIETDLSAREVVGKVRALCLQNKGAE